MIVSSAVLVAALATVNSHALAKLVVPPPVSKRNLRRSLQVGVHKWHRSFSAFACAHSDLFLAGIQYCCWIQEGDRRREELELARGPVRETASGIQ